MLANTRMEPAPDGPLARPAGSPSLGELELARRGSFGTLPGIQDRTQLHLGGAALLTIGLASLFGWAGNWPVGEDNLFPQHGVEVGR
jgi:hypothetical protein